MVDVFDPKFKQKRRGLGPIGCVMLAVAVGVGGNLAIEGIKQGSSKLVDSPEERAAKTYRAITIDGETYLDIYGKDSLYRIGSVIPEEGEGIYDILYGIFGNSYREQRTTLSDICRVLNPRGPWQDTPFSVPTEVIGQDSEIFQTLSGQFKDIPYGTNIASLVK